MAIVQVSRITQRKGLQEDLPQPLASAELGWATDQRRLFIGNGTLDEGAPIVGNTEILTEFSDLLNLFNVYIYKGEAAGYIVQTGPGPGTDTSTSLQRRLDYTVSVKAFGATGDGVTDDTEAINRALYQLYCIQTNPQVRRSLFFPAGVYLISNTLLIPPYCFLYGEGQESSIIRFEALVWQENTAYSSSVLVKYENPSTSVVYYYRAIQDVPATGITLDDTDYWDETLLPEYVINTCDTLLQTGASNGQNGAIASTQVDFSRLSVVTQEYGNDSSQGHSVLLIDRATDCRFDRCSFSGPLTNVQLDTALEDLALVRTASDTPVSGSPNIFVKNILFTNCNFTNATYAFDSDTKCQQIIFRDCNFDTLYQGALVGGSVVYNGGPSGVRFIGSTWDNIYAEGIIFQNVSLCGTAYNTWYDVGNYFLGTTYPQTSIIVHQANNNVSIGDLFQRTDSQAETKPRIKLWNSVTSVVPTAFAYTNSSSLNLGSLQIQSGQQQTLLDNSADEALFTVDTTISRSQGGFVTFIMDYTIYRQVSLSPPPSTDTRVGYLRVTGSLGSDVGESVEFTDEYDENADVGVTLNVTETDDIITVSYTTTNTGYDGTIYYSLRTLG